MSFSKMFGIALMLSAFACMAHANIPVSFYPFLGIALACLGGMVTGVTIERERS